MSNLRVFIFVTIVVCFATRKSSCAKHEIVIDVDKVKTTMVGKGAGFCGDFITDDISMARAVSETRAVSIRYPAGSLGENYLFHDPDDYTGAVNGLNPHAVTRTKLNLGDINPDLSYKKHVMDFDEFMDLCRESEAEPVIMINVRGYKLDGSVVTKEDLLQHAHQWVRYANVTRAYKVKYWEIGNEEDLHEMFSASEYAGVFSEFAKVMKAADPSIHVGMGIYGSEDHYRAVLQKDSSAVDFLVAHAYIRMPDWETYKNNKWGFLGGIERAANSIDKYADPKDKARIEILITEHHVHQNSENTENWLWKGLGVFEQIAVMFSFDDRIRFTHKWFTTNCWGNRNAVDHIDSFDRNSNWKIQNTGRPIQVFNQFLQETMLNVDRIHGYVRCYASYTPKTEALTVYLVNNNDAEEEVAVKLANYSGNVKNQKWIFTGPGPMSSSHTWGQRGSVAADSRGFGVTLDPVSFTVVAFDPSRPEATERE